MFNTSRIQRANLDGSTVEDLVLLGTDRPIGLAVNPTLGKVYWVANRVVGGLNTIKPIAVPASRCRRT